MRWNQREKNNYEEKVKITNKSDALEDESMTKDRIEKQTLEKDGGEREYKKVPKNGWKKHLIDRQRSKKTWAQNR